MPIRATTFAVERSTFVVRASFFDEDDGEIIPDTLKWTLQDDQEVVINSKEDVVISIPDHEVDIVLSGADLILRDQRNVSEVRRLIIMATYTSTLGAGLPLNEGVEFLVYNTNPKGARFA